MKYLRDTTNTKSKRIPVRMVREADGYRLTTDTIPPFTAIGEDSQAAMLSLIRILERTGSQSGVIVLEQEESRLPCCSGPFSQEAMSVLQRAVTFAVQDRAENVCRKHLVAACRSVGRQDDEPQSQPDCTATLPAIMAIDTDAHDVLKKSSVFALRNSCPEITLHHLRLALASEDK